MSKFDEIRAFIVKSFHENPSFTMTFDDLFEIARATVPSSVDAKMLTRMKILIEKDKYEGRTICLNTELVAFDILPPKYDDSEPFTSIAKVRYYLDEQGIIDVVDYDVWKDTKNTYICDSLNISEQICNELELSYSNIYLPSRNTNQDLAFVSTDTFLEILLTSDKTRGCAIFWSKMIKLLVLYFKMKDEANLSEPEDTAELILGKIISDGYQATLDRKKIFNELRSIKESIENLDPNFVLSYTESDIDIDSHSDISFESDVSSESHSWRCSIM